MSERIIQHEIREALGLLDGCVFWRNSTGFAIHGERRVRYGLAVGSSDLIGLVDGRFCALEVKRPGERPTEDQRKFMNAVRVNGGFAAVVSSVTEAIDAIYRCRTGEVS